jgi:hypothetical protein
MVSERKGKFYFHKFRSNMKMSSIASLRQSKVSKEQVFVFINDQLQTLNLMKIPLIFDPRASPECVENYLIKQ